MRSSKYLNNIIEQDHGPHPPEGSSDAYVLASSEASKNQAAPGFLVVSFSCTPSFALRSGSSFDEKMLGALTADAGGG